MKDLNSIKIFGIKITIESEENILKYILENLKKNGKKLKIFTPNPEIIMYGRSHPEFKRIVNEADINLPDGIGLIFASKLLGLGLKKRITGVDFIERLCDVISKENLRKNANRKNLYSVGFFGGRENVAKTTSKCLQKKYSGIKIAYASEEWNESKIMGKEIDILFVAMGFPKQENWIHENINTIPAHIAMGVGGAFDFISGKVFRAPIFLRMIGLEWLFRLLIQPWRIKRQITLILFTFFVFEEFLKLRFSLKKT